MPVDDSFSTVYMTAGNVLSELRKIKNKEFKLYTRINRIQTGNIFIVDEEGYFHGWLDFGEGHLVCEEFEDKRIRKDHEGCTWITVADLIHLLTPLKKEYLIYGKTAQNTGNLPIVLTDGRQLGYINTDLCTITWDFIPAEGEYDTKMHLGLRQKQVLLMNPEQEKEYDESRE